MGCSSSKDRLDMFFNDHAIVSSILIGAAHRLGLDAKAVDEKDRIRGNFLGRIGLDSSFTCFGTYFKKVTKFDSSLFGNALVDPDEVLAHGVKQ